MKSQKKQSGTVLIIGVVMLLVLSVLVVAGSKTTMLQQKMTNNFRDKEFAFQAAETAIRTGERYLNDATRANINAMVFDGSQGFHSYDLDRSVKNESDWSGLNARNSEQGLNHVKGTPVYIIENIIGIQPPGGSLQSPQAKVSSYFRVTSKGKGGTDDSLVVLQTIYKK